MLDPAISQFFEERKEGWLKKNLKASMSESEQQEVKLECEETFAAKNWLPNAAKRAGQISIASHPCTFSHPSARKNKNGYVSSIIAGANAASDGLVRSGNINAEADALGNAAALDVYKYLMTELEDGQNLLTHIQNDTAQAREALFVANPGDEQTYDALKAGFLAMMAADQDVVTSSKIKQVYFPLGNNETDDTDAYHLLSILSPSGAMFNLRKRLDQMRFGDEMKENRSLRKANLPGPAYKEIYNLATIGYGGTKPQNISVLNNANAGKAHLFVSMPPVFEQRDIHFPTSNIFGQNIRYGRCRTNFLELHGLYKKDNKNMHVRARRDELYQDLVDYVLETLWQVRSVKDQYLATHSHLSSAQKIWLQVQEPPEDDQWLDLILKDIAQFIFHGYEKTLGKKAEKLGGAELQKMAEIVEHNREILR